MGRFVYWIAYWLTAVVLYAAALAIVAGAAYLAVWR